jgi:hypothetical protein
MPRGRSAGLVRVLAHCLKWASLRHHFIFQVAQIRAKTAQVCAPERLGRVGIRPLNSAILALMQ